MFFEVSLWGFLWLQEGSVLLFFSLVFSHKLAGLWFNLLVSWSYQSPFTCVPPKPSLFSRRPSAWASPYCVPKSVTWESTTECSYCVWPDYSPRQNLYHTPPELGAWLLLLKDTHSYFKNRMLGGRLWSSWLASLAWNIHSMSELRWELSGSLYSWPTSGDWMREETPFSESHSPTI